MIHFIVCMFALMGACSVVCLAATAIVRWHDRDVLDQIKNERK